MTNYNERLSEQLNYLMEYSYKYGRGEIPLNEVPPLIIARGTKQAITSLTRELVAEAKPEKRTPGYYSDSIDLYSRQCAANSWNKAIDEFEQNLLKALEEK